MHITANLIDFNNWLPLLSDYILYPFITILLCLLSVFVVLGNSLVVSAIWHENQLHSVTNYLIASLAAADCLVGLVVMPFSVISEIIIGSWTFGATWCDLWHSFDVLASTASIMNLCAISLDRYLAITNPISYPTKMTPRRVALLIVSLWTCSALISFPAIAWWRAVGDGPLQQFVPSKATPTTVKNISTTMISIPAADEFLIYKANAIEESKLNQASRDDELSLSQLQLQDHEEHQQRQLEERMLMVTKPTAPLYRCVFTDDTYYLLFSSIVSFYGPLCVMLYAYYRIYKAAVQQTRFLKYGSKQVMIGRNKRNKRSKYLGEHSNQGTNERYGLSETYCDGVSTTDTYDTRLVLRAHRGGGGCADNTTKMAYNNSSIELNNNHHGPSARPERRRRDNSDNSDLLVQSSVDDECRDGRTVNRPSCSTDATGLASGSNEQQRVDSSQQAALFRQNRIEQINTKRDRLRIGSQRFDSKTINEHCIINYSAPAYGHHQLGKSNLKRDDTDADSKFNERPIVEEETVVVDGDIDNPVSQSESLYKTMSHSTLTSRHAKPPTRNDFNELQSNKTAAVAAAADREPLLDSQGQQQQQQSTERQLRANVPHESFPDQAFNSSANIQLMDKQPRSPLNMTQVRNNTGNRLTTARTTHTATKTKKDRHRLAPRDSSTISRSSNNRINGRDNLGSLRVVNEDESQEEFYDDTSSSSGSIGSDTSSTSSSNGRKGGAMSMSVSSGSYGTGSVASVLVRPQSSENDNLTTEETRVQTSKNCDINNDSQSSNSKLRRALSVGEAGHDHSFNWDVDIESALNEDHKKGREQFPEQQHNIQLNSTDQPRLISSTINAIKGRHRASCGNAIGDLRAAKTLDIRSWVRMARNKPSSKSDDADHNHHHHYHGNHHHDKGILKPPPSLLPLMMMNSDTSTDSSITATEGLRISEDLKESLKSQPMRTIQQVNSNTSSHDNSDSGRGNSQIFDDNIRRPSSTKASKNKTGQQESNLSREPSFKEEFHGANKVQMLYYDSDKLIQSIIDLTDIHYIDCSNQSAQNRLVSSNNSNHINDIDDGKVRETPGKFDRSRDENKGIGVDGAQGDKRVVGGDGRRRGGGGGGGAGETLALNDQVQIDDGTKRVELELASSNVPRQQRSVGKKLTKLAKERKAAKTLGIVVGVFILCWLPFFLVNIVVALCGMSCIYEPQILLSIVTWLGWLNKTLDIRSWVRMARNKPSSKSDDADHNHHHHYHGNHHHDKGILKPPPSLLPLMMMNSDTSTDSSITATEGLRISEDLKESLKSQPMRTIQQVNSNTSSHDNSDSGRGNSQIFDDNIRRPSSTKASKNKTGQQESNLSREPSFKEEFHGANKVQMLYYDSDKLIQSIIDLTDIHYIDCSNQSAQNRLVSSNNSNHINDIDDGKVRETPGKFDRSRDENKGIGVDGAQGDKRVVGGDGRRRGGGGGGGAGETLALNDQVQIDDGTKRVELELASSNVPRQQRSVGKKLTKLAKERKAAKTLGIVVGVFILCWLPFFLVNIVVALCGMSCIYEPQILLSIVTWLGWLNSAMNPVIYACWSRDFRRAFRRVLCTWVEFLWPYDGAKLARKLGLKRSSNYSNKHSNTHLSRTASSIKCTATTTTTTSASIKRSGMPTHETVARANGGHKSLLSSET